MVENPGRGVLVPDDLPHEYILKVSRPYLGRFISTPSDWTPLRQDGNPFPRRGRTAPDPNDPWQFSNFLIEE
jgi:homospermidine synthase